MSYPPAPPARNRRGCRRGWCDQHRCRRPEWTLRASWTSWQLRRPEPSRPGNRTWRRYQSQQIPQRGAQSEPWRSRFFLPSQERAQQQSPPSPRPWACPWASWWGGFGVLLHKPPPVAISYQICHSKLSHFHNQPKVVISIVPFDVGFDVRALNHFTVRLKVTSFLVFTWSTYPDSQIPSFSVLWSHLHRYLRW